MKGNPVRQPGSVSTVADAGAWFLALLSGMISLAAAEPPPGADQFYDPEVVQAIYLEITPEDLDPLHRALPERIYVPATFR